MTEFENFKATEKQTAAIAVCIWSRIPETTIEESTKTARTAEAVDGKQFVDDEIQLRAERKQEPGRWDELLETTIAFEVELEDRTIHVYFDGDRCLGARNV